MEDVQDQNFWKLGGAIDDKIDSEEIRHGILEGKIEMLIPDVFGKIDFPSPPGRLNELIENIMECSMYPQHNFATASAVFGAASIMMNKFCFQRTYPNIYMLLIGPTGCGKTVAMDAMTHVMNGMGFTSMFGGAEDYGSEISIIHALSEQRELVWKYDEAQGLFETMNVKNNISTVKVETTLCRLFSSPGRRFLGKFNKTDKVRLEPIYSPCLSILGTMTEKNFKGNLNEKTFSSGLLPRFIPIISQKYTQLNMDATDKTRHELVQLGQALLKFKPVRPCHHNEPDPEFLSLSNKGKKYYEDFSEATREVLISMDEESVNKTLLTRKLEMMNKLIVACAAFDWGGDLAHFPKVEVCHIEWSDKMMNLIMGDYSQLLTTYLHTDNFAKDYIRTENYIYRRGQEGVARGYIQNSTKMDPVRLDKILKALYEGKQILSLEFESKGRNYQRYVHKRHLDFEL